MIANHPFPHKLRYHHLMVAVLIVLAAFAIRSLAIYQRAQFDPSFVPQVGTDHQFYLASARGVLDGTFPTSPFYFHPGPSYFFAGIYTILGSDNFVLLTFVIALIDALTTGLLIGAGWLLTQRAWGGYLTGLIYAIYPVAIFYATTPLIAPLAAFFITGMIFITLWQRKQITLWRTIIIGIFAGLLAIHRLNLAPLAGLYGLWFLMLPISWRERITHGVIFAAIIVGFIVPFTYMNYQNSGGAFIPIATTGSVELYMANNRDAAGRHGTSLAMREIDLPYMEALQRDARVAPEHFYGLFIYKFALFWSDIEPGNNLNFEASSDRTLIIEAFTLRFSSLAILGLIGLSVLWYHHRESAIFLGLMLAWMCFGYVLVFAFGRIRFPAVIPLILLTGFGLVAVIETLFLGIHTQRTLKRHSLTLIVIIALYGFTNWALYPETKLPPERTYTELPADAIGVDAQFGEVTLLGWRYLDEWSYLENGWVPIFESYAVELFWQINQPTEIPYNFFLAYIDENQRYDAVDAPIGAVSFPSRTTDTWQANQIIGEIVSIRLDEDIPQARSGQIRVGVWYWDETGTIANVSLNNGDANLLLDQVAMFNPFDMPEISLESDSNPVIFGNQIALINLDAPQQGTVGETVDLSFTWQAIANIREDYRVFVHVTDESGDIITQADQRPIPTLFTQNWMVDYQILESVPLELPSSSGTYEIYVGLYNSNGRLSVDAAGDRHFIGTIEVAE